MGLLGFNNHFWQLINCSTEENFAITYPRISKFILFADSFITHNDNTFGINSSVTIWNSNKPENSPGYGLVQTLMQSSVLSRNLGYVKYFVL